MLNQRLKLGRYFGIPLYIHWSVALVVLWIGFYVVRYSHEGPSATQNGAWSEAVFAMLLIVVMYLCVVLHEYGHSLTARYFGVQTVDITLLPIGGIARLERMPRIPWHELLVAVAGPAVNVVIALGIIGTLVFVGGYSYPISGQSPDAIQDKFNEVSVIGFAATVMRVNQFLVLFNMVPAFPMDGGRVFRSLMAMFISYRRATWLAARVGVLCAVLMAWVACFYAQNPILLLISVFVAWAGISEAKQVDRVESVRGLRVADAMVRDVPTVEASLTVQQAAELWSRRSEKVLPVTSSDGGLVGLVRVADVAEAIREGQSEKIVADLAHSDTPITWEDQTIEELITSGTRESGRYLPVMDDDYQIAGMLDLESVVDRAAMRGVIAESPELLRQRAEEDPRDSDSGSEDTDPQPQDPYKTDSSLKNQEGGTSFFA